VRSAAQFCGRRAADLIEAGLNEGAGRLALLALWAMFDAGAHYCRFACGTGAGNSLGSAAERSR